MQTTTTNQKSLDLFREEIEINFVRPTYLRDISSFIETRFNARLWGYRCELAGKILTGVATTAAFMAGSFSNFPYGGFISGSLGILAMSFQHLSSFLLARSKDATEQLNTTLVSLKIDAIVPNVIDEKDME